MDDVEDRRDPRQALDAAHAQQIELLARARRAVAEVVTARKRLELQARQLAQKVKRLEAQEAPAEAAAWRAALEGELAELGRQTGTLAEEEARLRQVASALDLRVQQLRARRDALLAGYQAARARAEVAQVLAEVRAGDPDLLHTVQEAEQRAARTRAISDGLEAQRALTPPSRATEEETRREEELLWGPAAEEERQDGQRKEGPETGYRGA